MALALGLVTSLCVLFGGEKTRSGGNGGRGATVPPGVTAEEIAQGWRLESVATNDAASYAMPTNGVEHRPWSLRGGRDTHFALDLGDFAFPFGTGVVRRLDVLSGGMVESLPRQRVEGRYSSAMSICAAREQASIVPGVGRFWWADAARSASGPYQGKVLTWENVFGGRDRTGQYNAQIELCGDGNFVTRSNNVERVYRRVLPYDLDNDGLPNAIDPEPETPLVPSAWNQSDAWAAAAFPSNAAEIASAGGYAAWAAARASDPDRRLVSLGVSFADGSPWPALLDFGGVPVAADGAADLVFAIDCGAKVPFSLSGGIFSRLAVDRADAQSPGPSMVSLDGGLFSFPCDLAVGDVTVHMETPRSGWLCRVADVTVDGSSLAHLYPGAAVGVAASIANCHADAYIGCTWLGGEGIAFSDAHSLTTGVTYASCDPVAWATNVVSLVTYFQGGQCATNTEFISVGTQSEPTPELSVGCQEVFFLNDADFLGVEECPTNRPERIRPVTLRLVAPCGARGTATLSAQGGASPVVFHVVNGETNRVTSATRIPLAVTNSNTCAAEHTVYVSCPVIGPGSLSASLAIDGGDDLSAYAEFRCVEPLRKLVTTEKTADGKRYVNPSRLVMGTNAVLKVGVMGEFSAEDVDWRVVSGPGRIVATNGWCATVEPTGANEDVIVEARFNGDEIQPRFVLPVVQPRTIPVRMFVVEPPSYQRMEEWKSSTIFSMLDTANEIFTQVGIRFELAGGITSVGTTNDWNLALGEYSTNAQGRSVWRYSSACANLLANCTAADCIEIYFTGSITFPKHYLATTTPYGIVIGRRKAKPTALAHELGHALGLEDCRARMMWRSGIMASIAGADDPLDGAFFIYGEGDWGKESGRGFYGVEDTRIAAMGRMLMQAFSLDERADIPAGFVISLTPNSATEAPSLCHPKVGANHVKERNEEAYSR
jgi:hypothetical protein